MKPPCRCESDSQASKFNRHYMSMIKWLLPCAALALMPKCPACVAGYLALATGVGVSVSTASYLRTSLVVLCLVSLLLFAASSWTAPLWAMIACLRLFVH